MGTIKLSNCISVYFSVLYTFRLKVMYSVMRLWKWCLYLYLFFNLAATVTVGQHLRFESALTTNSTSAPHANGTTAAGPTKSGSWQGYVGAAIAVIFFGSNFIPVKKFESGDGMFFQWILCTAIWMSGLITYWVLNFPKFYSLAMLGGFLWATGNVCVVPIIKTIGLGLGILIWGSFNLLSGWASGRFGWFGLTPQIPPRTTLNYIAIACAMVSAIFWVLVKSQPVGMIQTDDNDDDDEENEILVTNGSSPEQVKETNPNIDSIPWEDRLSPLKRRLVGCILSVFSGTLYGLSFTPVIHIKNNYPGASQTDIDYVFAHFSGIYATSTIYFVVYCIAKKNKPNLYPSIVLPGIISGAMWGVADIGWFIANNYLSEAVSFPIITTGPGIIASLWGVIVFKEVKGLCNFAIMGVAYAFTITGAVLAGFSKVPW